MDKYHMKNLVLVVFSLMLAACNSGDIPEVTINSASHMGAGCPAGTGDITLSSDRRTLSVLFDNYEAVDGLGSAPEGGSDLTTSRVACNMLVSLHIPSGYQAFLVGADFRGSVTLPIDATAQFTREYFFAGDNSPSLTEEWNHEVDNVEIKIFDDLYADAYSYSLCGEDVILRSNTSLYVSAPADGDTALIQLDSFDYLNQPARTQFDYEFSYVRCS